MKLEARGRTSSLSDLVLTCTCGVENRNLDGAIGPLADFGTCRGARPWLGPETEDCQEIPRVLQRGASNVWYPAVRSSISIPPYSEALSKFVDPHWPLLSDPDRKVLTAWGAYGEKQMYGKTVQGVIRSTFVVDEKGKIAVAQYNVKATGHVAKLRRDLSV